MIKTVVITGGNRGIGLETGKILAEKGHQVILGSRNMNSIPVSADNITPVQLDVTDETSMHNVFDIIHNEFGHLDVLINNAGIGVGSQGAVDPDFTEVRNIFETNFYGAWKMIQIFLPLLKKSGHGQIINISSGMGALGDLVGGYAGYRLSKSSLNALTILLANELKDTNIRINAVCPGWVKTDMGGKEAPGSVQDGADTPVWLVESDDVPTGKFIRKRKIIPW